MYWQYVCFFNIVIKNIRSRKINNFSFLFFKSSTPVVLLSLILSITCKEIYILNTPLYFLLFFYFINTTFLLLKLYPKIIYVNFYILNKMLLLFLSFLYFSSNKNFFDVSYGIYCMFIIFFVLLLYFIYYIFRLKKNNKKKNIPLNFSSYVFDYFIIIFFVSFGTNSNILSIPITASLFDTLCVILILEGSLQLNKKFNKK